MSIPYIGFSDDSLSQMPKVKKGNKIICMKCNNIHTLEGGADGSELLLFYKCDNNLFLGAIVGKLVDGIKPDVSGKI